MRSSDDILNSFYKPQSSKRSADDILNSFAKPKATSQSSDDILNSFSNPDKWKTSYGEMKQEQELATRRQQLGAQLENYGTRLDSVGIEQPKYNSGLNNILKILGALDKPRAALWGGVVNALDGDSTTTFGQGLKEGFTGEKTYTGKDLMEYLFGTAETGAGKFAQGVGGFAAEIALDPMTYISTGLGSLLKGAVTGTGKSLTSGAAALQASGLLGNINKEALEGAVRNHLGKAGKEFTEEAVQKMATRAARMQSNKVLSEYGVQLGKEALGGTADDVVRKATEMLSGRMMAKDAVENAMTRGLGIGTRNNNLKLATNAQMQDLGAKGAQWVRQNTGVVGDAVGTIQDTINKIFSPKYIQGLTGDERTAMRFFQRRMTGSVNAANQALVDKTKQFASTLYDMGIDDARKQDKMITMLLENAQRTVAPDTIDDVSDAAKNIMNVMRDDFKAWGIDEKKIGLLRSELLDNYFPHVKSWQQTLDSQKLVRGGITESKKLFNPSSLKRQYGNNVFYANQSILFKTSTDVAKEEFFDALKSEGGNYVDDILKKVKGDGGGNALALVRDKLGYEKFDAIARETLDGMQDYFETSALSAYVTRGLSHNKVLAEADFMQNVLSAFGDRIQPGAIKATINEGYDVVIPKSATKIFGMNLSEYTDVKHVAEGMLNNIKSAGKEITEWHKYLAETEKAIADGLASNLGAADLGKLLDDKMAILGEIEKLKPMMDNLRDTQTVKKMPKEVEGILSRIIGSSDDLTVISAGDWTAVAKYFPIEAYRMPGGVIEYMNTALKNQKDQGFEAIAQVVDRFHSLWKPTVTGLQPTFHARNAIGSTSLNFMDIGFKTLDPSINANAVKLAKGSADDVIEIAGRKIPIGEIRDGMVRNHAISTGIATDTASMAENYMRGIADIVLPEQGVIKKTTRKVLDAGMKATDVIEGQVRGVNFLANMETALEKGLSIKEAMAYAGSKVQQFHFDYTDLTKAERTVMRRLMPFYTFARKNMPLQLEQVLNRPATAMMAGKWNRSMEGAYDVDSSNLPNWMKDQMAMALPFMQKEGGRTPYTNMNLPVADITNFGSPGDMLKNTLGMLTPLAKAPVELASNRTMLSGAPIWRNEGEKNTELLKYALNQFGVLRDAVRAVEEIKPDDVTAQRPVDDITKIPYLSKLLRGYDEEAGAEQAMYQYNRQLGNEVQYRQSQGENIPDTRTAELLNILGSSIAEQFRRTGDFNPALERKAKGMKQNRLPSVPRYNAAEQLERLKRSIY